MAQYIGKCLIHKETDAAGICSVCSAALCADCLLKTSEGRPICGSCLIKVSAKEDSEKNSAEKAAAKVEEKKKKIYLKRLPLIGWLILFTFVGVIAMVEVKFMARPSSLINSSQIVSFERAVQSPSVRYGLVFDALHKFRNEKKRWPISVTELVLEGFWPSSGKEKLNEKDFEYSTNPSVGFVLRLKTDDPFFKLVEFTESGLRLR